jgi:hypothetical protein
VDEIAQPWRTYLRDRGVETVYLDGVVKAVELYERNGFRKVCRSWRFLGHLSGKSGSCVRQMITSDLAQVFRLDQLSFGADRSFFLRRRFEIYPQLSYVILDGENPVEMLKSFALPAGDIQISIGILENIHRTCDLVRFLGFVERADSPWRMALVKSNYLGSSPRCYAVGSAAKG